MSHYQKNRSIGISAEDLGRYKHHTPEKALQGQINLFKATKVVGEQYGLTYQTQPDNIKNDWSEIWIESATEPNVSFISCTKKDSPRSVPQCSHEFYDSKFRYSIRYDKRLLPEWNTIRENVLKLMESFESKETAHDFISEQYLSTFPEQMGAQP